MKEDKVRDETRDGTEGIVEYMKERTGINLDNEILEIKQNHAGACFNKKECEENFEYSKEEDFEIPDFGTVRLFGACSNCGRRGWGDFKYFNFSWEE